MPATKANNIVGSKLEFSREQQLLLLCARTRVDEDANQRIRQLAAEHPDWELLARTATSHGIMPLLYLNLSEIASDLLPQALLEQLRAAYYFNLQRNRANCDELLHLLDTLADLKIAAVPFKGPALAAWAYGDGAKRQYRDMDILVAKRDFLAARDSLVAQGYRPLYEASGLREETHLLSHYASEFISRDNKVRVDLHWGFARRFAFLAPSAELMRERLHRVSLGERSVPTFAPADTLLLLALHGSKHGWTELKQICDLAEATRAAGDLPWDSLLQQAKKLGLRRMLLLGWRLAQDLLGLELPPELGRQVHGDEGLTPLVEKISRRLFVEQQGEGASGGEALRLAMLDSRWYRMRYRWHQARYRLAPTEKDWSLVALPKPLSAAYFLIRPLRVLSEWAITGRNRRGA